MIRKWAHEELKHNNLTSLCAQISGMPEGLWKNRVRWGAHCRPHETLLLRNNRPALKMNRHPLLHRPCCSMKKAHVRLSFAAEIQANNCRILPVRWKRSRAKPLFAPEFAWRSPSLGWNIANVHVSIAIGLSATVLLVVALHERSSLSLGFKRSRSHSKADVWITVGCYGQRTRSLCCTFSFSLLNLFALIFLLWCVLQKKPLSSFSPQSNVKIRLTSTFLHRFQPKIYHPFNCWLRSCS